MRSGQIGVFFMIHVISSKIILAASQRLNVLELILIRLSGMLGILFAIKLRL